jgi:plasmid stabilization system protein ParE
MAIEPYWAPPARRDLRRAVEWLEQTDPDAVPLVVGPVLRKIDSLRDSPYSGEIWRKVGSREFRETLAGNYRIFFEFDPVDQTITIQRICHVREQDPDFSE